MEICLNRRRHKNERCYGRVYIFTRVAALLYRTINFIRFRGVGISAVWCRTACCCCCCCVNPHSSVRVPIIRFLSLSLDLSLCSSPSISVRTTPVLHTSVSLSHTRVLYRSDRPGTERKRSVPFLAPSYDNPLCSVPSPDLHNNFQRFPRRVFIRIKCTVAPPFFYTRK